MIGVDVSNNNGRIEWGKVVRDRQQVRFAYAKATEGVHFTDPLYNTNRIGCRINGIQFGAYHFGRPGTDPVAQAKHFAQVATPKPGDLTPMLDLEVSDGRTVKQVRAWVAAFLVALDHRSIPCGIYTTPSLAELAPQTKAVAKRPLWIAHVGPHGAPRVKPPTIPEPWKHAAFWQYAWVGKVSGIRGDVDVDKLLSPPLGQWRIPAL